MLPSIDSCNQSAPFYLIRLNVKRQPRLTCISESLIDTREYPFERFPFCCLMLWPSAPSRLSSHQLYTCPSNSQPLCYLAVQFILQCVFALMRMSSQEIPTQKLRVFIQLHITVISVIVMALSSLLSFVSSWRVITPTAGACCSVAALIMIQLQGT